MADDAHDLPAARPYRAAFLRAIDAHAPGVLPPRPRRARSGRPAQPEGLAPRLRPGGLPDGPPLPVPAELPGGPALQLGELAAPLPLSLVAVRVLEVLGGTTVGALRGRGPARAAAGPAARGPGRPALHVAGAWSGAALGLRLGLAPLHLHGVAPVADLAWYPGGPPWPHAAVGRRGDPRHRRRSAPDNVDRLGSSCWLEGRGWRTEGARAARQAEALGSPTGGRATFWN